jgi:PAS domain S-box-containing protein
MSNKCSTVLDSDELVRLEALNSYDILDTPKEKEFDAIVKMAAQACNAPVSLISFVTQGRQWFKAEVGTGLSETPLDSSICSHAIRQKELFVVPDTTKDARTRNNPLVTGDPHVRFYAGALLETPEGLPLGTVCILDYKPRTLNEQEASSLKALARMVMTQLELRRTLTKLRRALEGKSKSEERSEFLSRLTQKFSMLSGPEELNRLATREVGQFLGGQRCYFFEAIPPDVFCRVLPDWCVEGEKSLQGDYDLAVFGEPDMWKTLNTQSLPVHDSSAHPWTVPWLPNYQAMNIGAALIAPFTRDGKWVCCLGVGSQNARQWTKDEQLLLENVMARVWPLIEKARIEVALRESEERFRVMSDNIAPLAWMAKADGLIFWYNKRWYDFTGTTLDEMQGDGWKKCHDPEHLPNVVASWQKAITLGHFWEHTFPLRGADGEYRWFLSRAFPIRDADEKITIWFGVNTDISDLRDVRIALQTANLLLSDKAALLETIVQQRTQKLSETVEELAAYSYSISHDMRAPLRAMIGLGQMLMEEEGPSLSNGTLKYLARITTASSRMDKLIEDVLVFSRLSSQDIDLEPIDIDTLLHDIIRSYPNFDPSEITISIKNRLPAVKGNQSLLTQCFSNLLENSKKFKTEGTKPQIEIWSESSNGRVKLFFKDNGIGIATENLDRIFDIFQRVGRDKQGTGIGLSIVRKSAEKMCGTVQVESSLGKGSTFCLDLFMA